MSSSISFAVRIVAWQPIYGRSGLPWQHQGAYEIWLSEIMLQQTQVVSVVPFYLRFIETFPNVDMLANAHLDDVLALWSGLGYYARARNLHASAKLIVQNGAFPDSVASLIKLPGIGLSTAAAIVSLAFKQPAAIFDGNVKRVLARHVGMQGDLSTSLRTKALYAVAQERIVGLAHTQTHHAPAIYTQGMMDLGALICTKQQPKCLLCPVSHDCIAQHQQQTHLIPAPKPRVLVKDYSGFLLIFCHTTPSGSLYVLLERRPAKGIWAQLWSFPLIDNDPEILPMAAAMPDQSRWRILPDITHVLTHRKLLLMPRSLAVSDMDQLPFLAQHINVDESCLAWVPLTQALQLGLPKPTRVLLSQLTKF